jgi:hypothetical protein
LGVKPVLEWVNIPVLVPPSASAFIVGEAAVPQTVPLALILAPPVDEMLAPSIAVLLVTLEAVGSVNVGAVIGITIV